ncbi:hypothetical protein D3C87_1271470 [compost metagenome]
MPITDEDLLTIQSAINEGGLIWDNPLLNDIKRRIKNHYLDINHNQCCYCRKDFEDEFMLVLDIEHVLPKSLFGDFMFKLFNLSVSCKRCNMRIKRNRVDFLTDHTVVHLNADDPDEYLFSHPNLDNYFTNIEYLVTIHNHRKSIKYLQLTPKGIYTYAYFELEKIEIDTLNEAQGIAPAETNLSIVIPADIVAESKALLSQL